MDPSTDGQVRETSNADKNCLEVALDLIAAGYSVISVSLTPERFKQPLIQWKEFQDRLASPEEIQRWFTACPDAGIALVTGQLSGVSVASSEARLY
jgi:hypothetical protein